MKITVTVESDEGNLGDKSTVSNTRSVGVGGPHEWARAIARVSNELGELAAEQLLKRAEQDEQRRR